MSYGPGSFHFLQSPLLSSASALTFTPTQAVDEYTNHIACTREQWPHQGDGRPITMVEAYSRIAATCELVLQAEASMIRQMRTPQRTRAVSTLRPMRCMYEQPGHVTHHVSQALRVRHRSGEAMHVADRLASAFALIPFFLSVEDQRCMSACVIDRFFRSRRNNVQVRHHIPHARNCLRVFAAARS